VYVKVYVELKLYLKELSFNRNIRPISSVITSRSTYRNVRINILADAIGKVLEFSTVQNKGKQKVFNLYQLIINQNYLKLERKLYAQRAY